jgi:hypothetical protein
MVLAWGDITGDWEYMWSKFLNIYYFIGVRLSIIMFNPDHVTPLERARRLKAAQKETKVAKTISIPISYWALLDQVRNITGKKNANETIMYCIKQIGIEEGIES